MSELTEEQKLREMKTLLALKSLRTRLEQVEAEKKEAIAIIGMACRFPAGADTPDRFWNLLCAGVDAISEVPPDRWDRDRYYDPDPDKPGKMNIRHGGFLERVFDFDAAFFGIAPREACSLDPQQRLLLEVSWEALEHAGLAADRLVDQPVGVFVGLCSSDHLRLVSAATELDAYMATGNMPSVPAGRLAYFFGFRGPAMIVDTACSSSLVSLHQACSALRNRECDLALGGGVNLLLLPDVNICLSHAHMLAADGRCKTFDAAANGYIRSEGCGVVVLKRLSDAVAQGDRILATIQASVVNQDGRTNGLTAPNGASQAQLIESALNRANLGPDDLSYLEAHGTGTSLGDFIEVSALGKVFAARKTPLALGSVKSNMGHLEAAAGIIALIKVVLALGKQALPGNLHFKDPNPHMDWANLPLEVVTATKPWPAGERLRYAGISSFGFSGTNAHLIVAEAPPAAPIGAERPTLLPLPLSARSESALDALIDRHLEALSQLDDAQLPAYCMTAASGRSALAYRCFFQAADRSGLLDQLRMARHGALPASRVRDDERPRLVWLFSGQGAQYAGMGRELYATQPIFKAALDRCDAVARPLLGTSLPELLFSADRDLDQTALTQPALFALEFALAQWWLALGLVPEAVMGHSVGEYVAAAVAGVFSPEDGMRLITERSSLMASLPAGGAMASIAASPAFLNQYLELYGGRVVIGAYNGLEQTVISGPEEDLLAILEQVRKQGKRCTRLKVSHAFHSPLMMPICDAFRAVANGIGFQAPRYTFVSNLLGKACHDEVTRPDYWVRHLLEPVHFGQGVHFLLDQGFVHFLELGPKPVLLGMLPADQPLVKVASMRAGQAEERQLFDGLGQLWLQGFQVQWSALQRGPRQVVDVPTYPFQRKTFTVLANERDPRQPHRLGIVAEGVHPLLGKRHRSPLRTRERFYDGLVAADQPFFLQDHRIFESVIVPGAAYLEMAVAAARDAFASDRVSLEDMMFPAALSLAEHQAATLQLSLCDLEQDRATVGVYSLEAGENWVQHAAGFVRTGLVCDSAPALQLEARCQDARQDYAGVHLYERLWSRGYLLGPAFQAVHHLWVGEGTALAEIKAPPILHGDLAHYSLHPVLLDACLQSTMAAMADTQDNFLPFSIERLHFLASLPSHFYVLTRARPGQAHGAEVRTVDLDAYDLEGRPLLRIEGFVVKRATSELLAKGDALWSTWLYETHWRDRPLVRPQCTEAAEESWLLLAPGSPSGHTLADLAREFGRVCHLAAAESAPASDQETHAVPIFRGDYDRLFRATHLPSQIVLLLDAAPIAGASPTAEVSASCNRLVSLVQAALDVYGNRLPKLTIVTRGAVAAQPSDNLAGLAHGPLWAFVRALVLEQPELDCRLIDLAPTPQAGELFELIAEIDRGAPEDHVALRGGRRLVARLCHARPGSAEPLPELDRGATYLITGGLGSLGLGVARLLAQCGARHLLLTGRGGVQPHHRPLLDELEAMGVQVLVHRADIAAPEQLAEVFAAIRASGRPLRGLIHAAGSLMDGLITDMDAERLERVLAPKVAGTWNLHQLCQDQPLDFFVLFSSVASLLGSPAQSNYAAANGFMDAFAHWRRANGLPALSLNWGTWAEIGMAADHHVVELWSRKGIEALDPKGAFVALAKLLRSPKPQLGIVQLAVARYLEQRKPSPLFDELLAKSEQPTQPFREQLEQLPPHQRPQHLANHVLNLIAVVLGLDAAAAVDPQKGFFEMGMDSLTSLELRNRLQSLLQISLPSTLAFTYGKPAELLDFLNGEILGRPSKSVAAAEVVVEQPVEINADDHSESDIAAMLAQELAGSEEDDYL